MKQLIDKLDQEQMLTKEEFKLLIEGIGPNDREYLFEKARAQAVRHYGKKVFTRGLIEFSNYCRNDCYYCGIRKGNAGAARYHLTKKDILECCKMGYELDFRTFVLQGGEDLSYSVSEMADIVSSIRSAYPDCAITLSIGERSYEDYLAFYRAGANRYLLRHETADREHYRKLHPPELSLENRMRCLWDLKRIGYQVGTGIMVGSPGQTTECIVKDLLFMKELKPHMIGIGPFIPHKDTPFCGYEAGSVTDTLVLLGILRLMFPYALIPATTALGTIDDKGREMGILAGANVVMPNLSPLAVRKKYMLYDNKISTGDEAAECRAGLERRMESIGYRLSAERGDCVYPLN
ncbi:[FeFe] hydrogenase H-cluster radical SAM maturase HydE [Clostridium sp. MCC353]|uniref:[FeFe] hydrogenase H-cluster radical SAM maturase HydE n=1 Tax=Clostridium sp. MCC353 TaxID=2592646 RepID=UPI001C02A289|nr:[FeFe] hydrogenase H-cluster radical SAM maturase HydE [Clostridium sp. MCC353]MBT9779805.1 [FeFe] hydrogenase H-cluster radical SAM maturase HydE [Clostridium sp. MCC353]